MNGMHEERYSPFKAPIAVAPFPRAIASINRVISRVERILLPILLSTMVATIFLDFVLRLAFNQGLVWARELASFLMIWCGFLGASAAAGEGKHLRVEAITKFLPAPVLSVVSFAASEITAVFCFAMTAITAVYVLETRFSLESSLILQLPLWMVQAIMPMGFFLIGVRFWGTGILLLLQLPADSAAERNT